MLCAFRYFESHFTLSSLLPRKPRPAPANVTLLVLANTNARSGKPPSRDSATRFTGRSCAAGSGDR